MAQHIALPLALLVVVVVPLAAADPPADAFCVILIEPSDDFRAIRVTVDEETNLTEREALWPLVDTDADGVVTPTEQAAFRWNQTRYWPLQEGLGVKAMWMQQQHRRDQYGPHAALYAASWRQIGHEFHQQDYELPGTLTRPIELETQEVREHGFQVKELTSRVIIRGGDESGVWASLNTTPEVEYDTTVIEYVIVRAPKGWEVERVTGSSYNGTFSGTPGKRVVELPAFDTKQPFEIVFYNAKLYEDEQLKGPGLPVVALLAALAVLAAGLRWRRS